MCNLTLVSTLEAIGRNYNHFSYYYNGRLVYALRSVVVSFDGDTVIIQGTSGRLAFHRNSVGDIHVDGSDLLTFGDDDGN